MGKVASEAVRILAATTQDEFPVTSALEAIEKLRAIGYYGVMRKDSDYYRSLFGQISLEVRESTDKHQIEDTISDLMKTETANVGQIREALGEIPEELKGGEDDAR